MDLLRGLHTSPWIVATVRGIVAAVIGAAIIALSGADVPASLIPFVPVLIALLRVAEGALDQLDPQKPS